LAKQADSKKYKSLYIQAHQARAIESTIIWKSRDEIQKSYGYIGDKTEPLWQNVERIISRMSMFQYFNRPKNMAYHNLCINKSPPKGIGSTLGLGLKFCIQSPLPPPNFKKSFERFTEDI
jgi:hypothetical protein